MKLTLWVVLLGALLLAFALSFGQAEAQTCMQTGGGLYSCSDGTTGMTMPGGLNAWSAPGGRQGHSQDLGQGMGTFTETQPGRLPRQGTYQQFGNQGVYSDNHGQHGQWQDVGPSIRSYSGARGSGIAEGAER